MKVIAETPLEDFAPDEFFLTTPSPGFPEFIATSAFFSPLADAHLTRLVAVRRNARRSNRGVPFVHTEFTLALPEALDAGNYEVGGDSEASLSITIDDAINEAVSGNITLNTLFEEKLGGNFSVLIEDSKNPGKTFAVKGSFNVQAPPLTLKKQRTLKHKAALTFN